ncbi:MAG: chemotaxis protein CheB [Thermodesulfovibrionia bacterium]|nr:chemotaxis protein CheB [Thermodesulfovibrionia bacterium]
MRTANKSVFYIVGIGASAGGLEAFEQFFTNMPSDSGMAFVLIPHLAPEHKSLMAELLQRNTKMVVLQAEDGMKADPNCVYIIPPDRDMAILEGTLRLLEPVERRGLRHPIDFFFRTLADDQGEKAVCIVLSGTGTEGALGLRAVKGKGGLVIVQDPKTTRYDGMPASSIATGLVDYILPPDKMPGQLMSYISHAYPHPPKPEAKAESKFSEPLYKIFVLIRNHTGHDFSLYKQNTILRRIEKRMAILQVESMADYVTYLRSNSHEIELLFSELLIRVTNFFRDREAFEMIKEKALPLLFKDRAPGQPVRIWIPACSTGEEAYSVAIIVQEYMSTLKEKYKVQIFATDIDREAIDMARTGLYPNSIAIDVSNERLNRFFIKKTSGYKIREEIRQMIVFAVQDIAKDPPFTQLHMISCRNVLIYFNAELQKKVIPMFHYSLKPGGILCLGTSETIGDHAGMFSTLHAKWKIFRAKGTEAIHASPFELSTAAAPVRAAGPEAAPVIKKREEVNMGALAEKIIMYHHAPPFVIVNDKGDILYFYGKTNRYLEPHSGKASLNIIEMAHEDIRLDLRAALRKAVTLGKDITVDGLQVKANGGLHTINLEVRQPGPLQGLLMIVFKEITLPKGQKAEKAIPPSLKMKRHVAELEHELSAAKEQLQTIIEELETTNQELRSTNEELQSSNEELQSTIEEMDTSKEELQSVNEELTTINAELQLKMDEASTANDDLNNLITGTQIATIFLDNCLRIKRFTPATVNVLNLVDTDVGRPIGDFSLKLDYPELKKDIENTLKMLTLNERVVRHHEGLWYMTRILPYRTTGNVIDGAVITFIDITAQKNAEEAQKDALAYAEGIVETVREPLIVLDEGLRVITANKSFYQTFKMSQSDVEKKRIYDLGNRQWDIPALRELLEKILPKNSQFEDFEVEHDFQDIGCKKMLLNASRIHEHGKQTQMILLAIEDITGRKK